MTSDSKRKRTSLKALIILDGWAAKFSVSKNSCIVLLSSQGPKDLWGLQILVHTLCKYPKAAASALNKITAITHSRTRSPNSPLMLFPHDGLKCNAQKDSGACLQYYQKQNYWEIFNSNFGGSLQFSKSGKSNFGNKTEADLCSLEICCNLRRPSGHI